MKAVLEFNLPEDKEEFEIAAKYKDIFCALYEIEMDVFRPARKYGYNDPAIKALFDKDEDLAITLVGLLEDKFRMILNEREIRIP